MPDEHPHDAATSSSIDSRARPRGSRRAGAPPTPRLTTGHPARARVPGHGTPAGAGEGARCELVAEHDGRHTPRPPALHRDDGSEDAHDGCADRGGQVGGAGVADDDRARAGQDTSQLGQGRPSGQVDPAERRDGDPHVLFTRSAGDHHPPSVGCQSLRRTGRRARHRSPGSGQTPWGARRRRRHRARAAGRGATRRAGRRRCADARPPRPPRTSPPPRATRRLRGRRRPASCGAGRRAARRGRRRSSPTTFGTPAHRASSAIGSGLWW